ncbi:MAG TPA: Calx-beta domain-containing protein [Oculatellaceae cyanobacterium]|jgi:subtilisin-like proprotein convertase family protein
MSFDPEIIPESLFTEKSIFQPKLLIGDPGTNEFLPSVANQHPLSLNDGFETGSIEEAARNIDKRLATSELQYTNSNRDSLTGLSNNESWAGTGEAGLLQAQRSDDLSNLNRNNDYGNNDSFSVVSSGKLRGSALVAAPATFKPALIPLRAGNNDSFTRVGVKANTNNLISANSTPATINVTYNGFTPQAQAAFEYAVDIWENVISSPVPIEINATWEPLDPGVLGQAGPAGFATDGQTLYPIALGNKLAGTDIDTTQPDINASFSSVFSNWYLGTDANTPSGTYDFVSVVLHEIGHGLGFLGSMEYSGGQGAWGYGTGQPVIYDRFAVNGSNQSLIDTSLFPNPSTALGNQLTSNNIFFNGSNAVAANGGTKPKLYAPSTWSGGSSYAHLDESTYAPGNPNSLMTPQLGTAEAIHDPGAITRGIFKDMGWDTATATSPGIYGNVWNDVNSNGIRDAGEAGLQNWTIYQDRNNNGVLDQATPGIVKTSTDIPKSIPDTATPITSNLAVSGITGTIQDVNVKLDISHTWNEDLDVFLIAPDGTRVELFTDVGSNGDNFTNTILDDEATTSIAGETAPFTGTFKPEGLLSTLDGKNPNGTWKLEITDDEAPDAGTLNSWSLTFNSTNAEVSTQTAADGSYSFTNLTPGNYTIREVLQSGWTQTAPSTGSYTVAYNAGDVVTNRDFGNAIATIPAITVTASDASAAERLSTQTANPGRYTFTRTGDTTNALTVNYTMSGTATNGADYNNVGTSISFAAGASSVTVPVNVIDDSDFEGTESAILTLTANSNYSISGTGKATVNIVDNDRPTITLTATDATAAESATGQPANPGQYTLTRSGITTSALTVNYAMSGTATNGTDYNTLGTSITFAAGQSSVTVPLNIIDDTAVEGAETAIMTLASSTAYNIGTNGTATVNIADNDLNLPVVTVTAADATAAETPAKQIANPGKYTFTRTGSTDTALTVNYTVGGTATSGTDYTALSGTISFAVGQSSVNLPLKVINDTLVEGNETTAVTLSANSAYTIGSANSATVTIADNDIGATATANGSLSTTDLANPTRAGAFMDDYELRGATVGQQMRINLNSSMFDTYLQVINAATGQVITGLENDDANTSTTNSQITFTPQSGINYLLRVTSYSNEVGDYILSTSPATAASVQTTIYSQPLAVPFFELPSFSNNNATDLGKAPDVSTNEQSLNQTVKKSWAKRLKNALSARTLSKVN